MIFYNLPLDFEMKWKVNTMELNCVIVDDEQVSVQVLEELLAKVPNVRIVETFNDPLSAVEFLSVSKVDFIFLDIEMPNLSGIDLLKSLVHPPLVIITSANKSYALEGYELSVADYLLKPISLNRVVKSVNKISELISHRNSSENRSDSIFLKENKRLVRINFADILFVESMKDYIKVVTKEKSVISKHNLSNFEKLLNPDKFVRVHKSYIVSLDHVEAFSCSEIEIGRFNIPIGRTHKDNALKRLGILSDS